MKPKFSNRYSTSQYLLLAACFMIGLIVASCGGNPAVSPAGSTTKLYVINTSPDIGPVAAFINNTQLGNSTAIVTSRTFFRYSTIPTYYSIGTGSLTFQLRTDHNIPLTSDTLTTKGNTNYTLFLMGLAVKDSLTTLLVNDVNTTLPTLGKAKMRFINASPRSTSFDVYANGSLAFGAIGYKKVSNYIEVPAGVYEFKLGATGAPANVFATLSRYTVQDGRLYTLYSKGMVGRIDSAAIALNVITNK